jgi:undecaprenyl-diphosphatase
MKAPLYRFSILGLILFCAGAAFAFLLPGLSPDRALSTFFAGEPLPALTPPVTLLTHLNSMPLMLLALLLILGLLLARRRFREALFAAVALLGTAGLNSLLKSLVGRPRPEGRLLEIHSPSFPSWHSATSAALALALWLLFVRPLPPGPRKSFWSFLLLLWPLLIGFTRLYLDVHWSSDILAGWGLGLLLPSLAALLILPSGNGDGTP